ncbi:kinase-like domain-containing protein [Mycena rebaudengoi]|nr:kinase-like domain-containing protein [Mycena rebaudengoi]
MSENIPDFSELLVDGGRLRLLHILGSGAFGVVYKAVDTASAPDAPIFYAVKCLGLDSLNHFHEKALHANVSAHPNIVTLERAFYDFGYSFIVLEIAAGGTLKDARDLGVFHNNNALVKEVLLQIIDAVEYCHNANVFHCDLKPQNILYSPEDKQLRIADFGLALNSQILRGPIGGTYPFMPPECFPGTGGFYPACVPRQNDVWALSIILLNLMSGQYPWQRPTLDDCGWSQFSRFGSEYLRSIFPISEPLALLLKRTLQMRAEMRPGLLEFRFEIASMQEFFMSPEDLLNAPPALRLAFAEARPKSFHPSYFSPPSQYSTCTMHSIDLDSVETPINLDDAVLSQAAPSIPVSAENSLVFPAQMKSSAAITAPPAPTEVTPEIPTISVAAQNSLAAPLLLHIPLAQNTARSDATSAIPVLSGCSSSTPSPTDCGPVTPTDSLPTAQCRPKHLRHEDSELTPAFLAMLQRLINEGRMTPEDALGAAQRARNKPRYEHRPTPQLPPPKPSRNPFKRMATWLRTKRTPHRK